MNWFYTSGGVQQGPVTWDALLSLAASGRLQPGDMVWSQNMPSWQQAGTIPGLFPFGMNIPPDAPMPPPSYAYPQPQSNPDAGLQWLVPVGDQSGWAIAAGYLGLFSLVACGAPFALIVGIIALNDIKKHPGRAGIGRAYFGIAMGAICTILYGGLILYSMFSKP